MKAAPGDERPGRQVHRWNRNPRPQPEKLSKLVFLVTIGEYCICLNWLSGALVGVGGSDFIGYKCSLDAAALGHAQARQLVNRYINTWA